MSDQDGGAFVFHYAVTAPTENPVYLPFIERSADIQTFEREVVRLVNDERVAAGCVPLAQDAQLDQAAEGHSMSMALEDFYSHTGRDGSTALDRIARAGYHPEAMGENIAAGQPSPATVVEAWMNSEGHRANILNCDFQEIGVGYFYLSPDPGEIRQVHYWTQVFASP